MTFGSFEGLEDILVRSVLDSSSQEKTIISVTKTNIKLVYEFDRSITKILFTKTEKRLDEESEETRSARWLLTTNPTGKKIPECVDWFHK